MTTTGLDSLNIVIWSVWAYIVAYLILVQVVQHRLEQKHHSTYENIAKPGPFGTDAITKSWNMLMFITFREHTHLDDRTLSRMSDTALLALCFSPIVFLAGAVYAVVAA
jgi:hypothetical protein